MMSLKHFAALIVSGLGVLTPIATAQTRPAQEPLPHLETRDGQTRLIVDGKPFLILGGEVGNSAASTPDSMTAVWPRLRDLNLNTVLVPVYWELLEPTEGRFDFTLIDRLIDQARAHNMRLVLLWFGAWKNSMSTYVPVWVKHDRERFPFARDAKGQAVEILSALAPETLKADAAAYTALMRHLREVDDYRHTVLMVQIENEIGFLPDAREYGPAADAAFTGQVPEALRKSFNKPPGTWGEIFGNDAAGEEVFMAWHYARYVNTLAEAGKAAYPLPTFVNAALNRPHLKPGQYPSAGPLPHLIDVWRAGAPGLDLLCPDIYFYDFANWAGKYVLPGHPLFIPETTRAARASANALYAYGEFKAIGYSPFAIDSIENPKQDLLGKTYGVLAQFTPKFFEPGVKTFGLSPIAAYDGTLAQTPRVVRCGEYELTITFDGIAAATQPLPNTGDPSVRGGPLPTSGGMILWTDADHYFVIGNGMKIVHAHTSGDKVGLVSVREWTESAGTWKPDRWLNGDQTNQGRETRLYGFGVQEVRLYRYR